MRGLDQSKAMETGIIFLSKIDKIIPDSMHSLKAVQTNGAKIRKNKV